ncbi:MAG: ABC transporter substrate-binding protein [Chloroflexi bacterium]|nr:ABC transporter substrate-binding protein [Chloroflexota bacterium]
MNRRWMLGSIAVLLLLACTSTPAAAPPTPVVTAQPTAAAAPTSAATPAASSATNAVPPLATGAATPQTNAATSVTPPQAAAASTPTAANALTKIAVSYPEGGAHLPLFIARDKGIFNKYGLDVDLKPLGGGSVATAALLGGDVQLVDITGSEIVTANAQGGDVVVLATLTPTYPYVFEVSKDITDKEDLKGKTIAIRAVGDATDIATRVMLKKEGLDPDKDVTLLAVQQEGARMAALQSGQICCSVAQVSDRLQLEKVGFHTLVDLTAEGLPNSQGVIAARRDYVQANPQVVQNFINSVVAGIALMKADKAGALPVLKAQLNLDDDAIVSATYDFFAKDVVPSVPLAQPNQFSDSIALLSEQNDKVKGFDISKYIDSSYVQNAVAAGLDKPPAT